MENEKKYNVESMRERLDAYVISEQDIDREIERLEYLISKMTSISSQVITGMPRSSNASTDRMADLLGRKEELEASIRASVSKQAEERKQLEDIIRHLRNAEERAVVRLKYLDRTAWNDVLEIMYGGRADFSDREETYRRRMFRIHGTAIFNMAKYIEEASEQNTAVPAT